MTVLGIDVSLWQDDNSTPQKMDFNKAKAAGANFVFIKVSERGFIDQDFEYNWQAAKDAGIPRGGYHFLRWDLSGIVQARIFCDILADDPGELPPVADFEAPPKKDSAGNVTHWPSNALLEQFLVEVENILGARPIIYTSPGFWSSYGKIKNSSSFDQKWRYWDLWIAHYTTAEQPTIPKPWETWTFWQYTANGDGLAFGAESKGIDLNRFNGDLMDFHAYMGDGELEPTTPEPPASDDLRDLTRRILNLEAWARGIGYKG